MSEVREALRDARRMVVKIGSRYLTSGEGRFGWLAKQIAEQRDLGREVVLVSSGAIALGRERLSMSKRPKDMPRLQAAAAAGQASLIRAYESALEPYGIVVGQVLLTHADLADRERYLNARGALDALLELGALPIINENDCVSVDEIRFGDNDQLAAMVATLVGADLLLLLTDVDGLLDADNHRVALVGESDDIEAMIRPPEGDVGTGGMASKVDAARRATRRGVPVVIGDARRADLLSEVLGGADVGTLFLPRGAKLPSRKHWIAYTLKSKGEIFLDEGAADAVRRSASLLAAGVVSVRGDFESGDLTTLLDSNGNEVARGLSRYDTADVARLAGAGRGEVEARLGRPASAVIVHRDDLVVSDHGTM